MNKMKSHDFLFHPYFNIFCIVLNVILGTLVFSFLTMSQISRFDIVVEEIKLYAFFVFLNILVLLFQFLIKKQNKLDIIIFFIILTVMTISILLREIFSANKIIFIVSQTLSLIAVFFVVTTVSLNFILLILENFMYDNKHFVLIKKELRLVRTSALALFLIIIGIPIFIFSLKQNILLLTWTILLLLFTSSISFGNYRYLVKKIIVGKEDIVLEYRSVSLYLLATKKQISEFNEKKAELENEINTLEDEKSEKFSEKKHFEVLLKQKPELAKEVGKLTEILEEFNIDKNKKIVEQEIQNKTAFEKRLWEENFSEKHDELESNIIAAKEQLQTAKEEMEQTKTRVEDIEQSLSELNNQIDDSVEKQNTLKTKHAEIAHQKNSYLHDIQNGQLEEDAIKKLEVKVKKASKKEVELHEKISHLEKSIMEQKEKQNNFLKEIDAFQEIDIPDYQYAITMLTEKLLNDEAEATAIQNQYHELLNTNFEYQQIKKFIFETEKAIEEHQVLLNEQKEKQKIIDIDCVGEIAKLDEQVMVIDEKIKKISETIHSFTLDYQKTLEINENFAQKQEYIFGKLKEEKNS